MKTTILELFNNIVSINNEKKLQKYVLNSMLKHHNIDSNNPLQITGVYTTLKKCNESIEFDDVKLDYSGPLIFRYCNHSGEWFIRELNSFEEVEEYILGEAGYLNMFTGIILVFYDGHINKYNVVRTLTNGEKSILEPGEYEDIKNAVVEWI